MAKQDMDMRAEETLEEGGSEPRVYELGFHLDPELPSEEVKKAYQAVRALIEEKGTIVAEGEPQKIQLAYTISRQETSGRRDFDSAFFSWIVYETPAESHADIIAAANAEKRIIRFIDLITTKDAARHAVEMHELALKTPERVEDPEEVAGAELDAALENVVV
jgi:ribosomal protein S6